MKGSTALVKMLDGYGVKYIFGLCGDTSLGFYDALAEGDHGMTHILARDERSASYMAEAYALISGRPGICEGPSGGGALFIVPGVAEAQGSAVPVIAINTDINIAHQDRGTLTEMDQKGLFQAITKWSEKVVTGSMLPAAVREAFKKATSGVPGAVHLALPMNVLDQDVPADEVHVDTRFSVYPPFREEPDCSSVEKAAELILKSTRPLIIAGGGVHASAAYEPLKTLVERLGIPVATSIMGKGSLAENHPYAIGVIGSNGGLKHRHDLVRKADLVIFIGMRGSSVTMDGWNLLGDKEKKIVHLDLDPEMIGRNYYTDVGVVGDARASLTRLNEVLRVSLPELAEKVSHQEILAIKKRFKSEMQGLFTSEETPIKPERIVHALRSMAPKETLFIADPGTPCPYLAAYIELPLPGRRFLSPRAHGALGFALPAVVGAHYGAPGSKIVSVMGDGSFAMVAGELETIARLSIPVTLIVINNASYGWIKAGQKSRGSSYFSSDFTPTRHADIAAAYGIKARRVEDPGELNEALQEALTFQGPCLLDIVTQPLEEARAPVSKWVV